MGSSPFWIAFTAAFVAAAVWESAHPLRPLSSTDSRRWRNHVALYAISIVCSNLALRTSAVVVAFAAQDSRYGLLNRAFIPYWVSTAAALPALDLLLYAGHRLFHSVGFLWRIHEVHHSDHDFDVSTAVRFHPFEVLITQGLYLGTVALLAPPPAAVFTSEILRIVENFFVHANKSLPPRIERILRWIVITPDVHRIHHSEEFAEQNLNFGQLFPWWDRLFRTYASAPAGGPDHLVTGLKELRGVDTLPVAWMLAEPFQRTGREGRLQSGWNSHVPPNEACPLCAVPEERQPITTASTNPAPTPSPRSARS